MIPVRRGTMGKKNGYFQLITKPDGTYMKLYATEAGGLPISYDDLCNYLIDRKIYEYDKNALGKALASGETTEFKLTETVVLPQDEEVKIVLTEDRMAAIGRFYPPSNNGNQLSKEDIVRYLIKAGVKYGVDEEQINLFLLERRYCTDIVLAKALPAVQGHDAIITYHFNTDLTLKPKTNEDGTVDFHQLDMISHCKKDQLLAVLEPADFGKPGIDVCGVVIRPLKVNNRVLRHGNKVHLSPDGLRLYSDVDGHVSLTEGRVFVSDSYEIAADVDSSTGDIVYEGNVIIKGNVITGFSVRAKGDIEVNGVVEGAYIEAGGHIILKRGMQGMNKGILKANGNIITKFIENAEVIAGGYITTESILHSKVSAKGDITVGGRRGFVTGGEIRSGTMISVKTAGSHMGTNTLLEVGIDPRIVDEYRELEKKIMSQQTEKDKITQALTLLRKKLAAGGEIPEDKKQYLQQITKTNIIIEAELKENRKRYEELRTDMEVQTHGMIKIQDIVYPGTKLIISNVIQHIREEAHHCKFIRDRADIKMLPL